MNCEYGPDTEFPSRNAGLSAPAFRVDVTTPGG
jgi:hypothetical protein